MRETADEGRREEGKEEMPPQQQHRDPIEAKCEPELVDLRGAGGEGAGKKQLLRGQQQQLPRSPRAQEEKQSEDCCACGDHR